ncbi:MAG TPA: hypothetical protein ENH19_01345, partial [Actinobacteria bacterium]|nr:hypothetical protein [Actinomycetes bacterium]HEX21281.1 hypothetical protein [Actinomycetota bacterium]
RAKHKKGEWLGIHGGRIVAVARNMEGAVTNLLNASIEKNDEVLTIFTGDDPRLREPSALDFIMTAFPGLDVEIKKGGQSVYPLIMSLE